MNRVDDDEAVIVDTIRRARELRSAFDDLGIDSLARRINWCMSQIRDPVPGLSEFMVAIFQDEHSVLLAQAQDDPELAYERRQICAGLTQRIDRILIGLA